jgi:hypothetical protein
MRYFHGMTIVESGGCVADAAIMEDHGIILFAGRKRDANPPLSAKKISLDGAFAYPGFIDSHGHLLSLGKWLCELQLNDARSFEELVDKAAAASNKLPAGAWLLGRGWDNNLWPDKSLPHHAGLSHATGKVPAFLVRIDGHAAIANEKALALAGITRETPDPPGGRIVRGENGKPTGVLIDNAADLVRNVIPQPGLDEKKKRILSAADHCRKLGLTMVHDAGIDETDLNIFRELGLAGKLPLRVYGMVNNRPSGEIINAGRFACRAVKLLADGALGSRGAALFDDYSDAKGERGLLILSEDEIFKIAVECARTGFQLAVHAIGDKAAAVVLDAFEKVLPRYPQGLRFRMEHLQALQDGDFKRIRQLGVIPSVQPVHFVRDRAWAPGMLGPERMKTAYAWKTLLETAGVIALGSDFPIESADPLEGFRASVGAIAGAEKGEWAGRKLTRTEALAGYTTGGAWASFLDKDIGAFRSGCRMDATMLTENILECPEDELSEVRVKRAIVDGEFHV